MLAQCECSVLVITLLFPVFRQSCLFPVCLGISIQTSVLVDPGTGLSTTSSTLEYSAEKEDADAEFTCSTQHPMGAELVSSPVTFTITCESSTNSTNNIHLNTLSHQRLFVVELFPRVISAQKKRQKYWLMMAFTVSSSQAMKSKYSVLHFSSPDMIFLCDCVFFNLLAEYLTNLLADVSNI